MPALEALEMNWVYLDSTSIRTFAHRVTGSARDMA